MPTVNEALLSNEFYDFIIPSFLLNNETYLADYPNLVSMVLSEDFALGMIPAPSPEPDYELLINNRYQSIPKLYTLLDTVSLEKSGIVNSQNHSYLNLSGEGVLIGLIDTGINYQNPAFLDASGNTRILNLWDQTIEGGTQPHQFPYGSEYTHTQINEALASEDPKSIVPSEDTNGHGTFMASVAAGTASPENDFLGAAPQASLVVVKLRECKPYLKDYFLISGDVPVYQESDIIAALTYFQNLAETMSIPNVICLGLGTNNGEHVGQSPLSLAFGTPMYFTSSANVVASGNEALAAHHYSGEVKDANVSHTVEVLVKDNTRGFTMELWGQTPEIFSVGFTSPSGETIERIPSFRNPNSRHNFVLDPTTIFVNYEVVNQLIFMRFIAPSPGVWRINVYCTNIVQGRFHIWLPITGFCNPDVVFLNPDPYTTLTVPSGSINVITTGAYNAYNDSMYINSGRGLNSAGQQKPDITSPGVDVYGVNELGNFVKKTGTSYGAAITAGAIALLLQWSAQRRDPPIRLNNTDVKNALIRGARRLPNETYPSREWGYGMLDLFSLFQVITNS